MVFFRPIDTQPSSKKWLKIAMCASLERFRGGMSLGVSSFKRRMLAANTLGYFEVAGDKNDPGIFTTFAITNKSIFSTD